MSVKPTEQSAAHENHAQFVDGFLTGSCFEMEKDLRSIKAMLHYAENKDNMDICEVSRLSGQVEATEKAIREFKRIRIRLVDLLCAM